MPFRGSWIEFATDINNVMYAYIDRKKKLPVTSLLRAIGLESDKEIIDIFGLAEEVKVNKTNLRKAIGRKLAARVLKTWTEEFSDDDTGEVTTLERNEVVVDRETVITEDDAEAILASGVSSILLHKEDAGATDYSIIFNTLQKDTTNSEQEAIQYIYRQLRNAEPPDDASAREVITNLFFSEKRYDLGEVGRYRINRKLNLPISPDVRVLTKEDIIAIIRYLIELINTRADVEKIFFMNFLLILPLYMLLKVVLNLLFLLSIYFQYQYLLLFFLLKYFLLILFVILYLILLLLLYFLIQMVHSLLKQDHLNYKLMCILLFQL